MNQLKTPVLFLVFNRPEPTQKVFDAIRAQQPKRLYIAADGPRQSRPDDIQKCAATKKLVMDAIDWDCEIKILFRDRNLGCGKGVSEAIGWFFENEEEGIILEDDCLPSDSFFFFCEQMLDKYREDEQVMHINGTRFGNAFKPGIASYYFSNYVHVYGWATWRRAWQHYTFDIPIETGEKFKKILRKKFRDIVERDLWSIAFAKMAAHEIDTWDQQWVYSIYNFNGIAITPAVNLVSNIGFGAGVEATHTHDFMVGIAALPVSTLKNIVHPQKIKVSNRFDRYTYKKYYARKDSIFNKLKFKTGKLFPAIKRIYRRFLS
jgi:hypothetical protein